MRTNHTYVCTECGKEHAKDWAYKPGHDDDPAMCDACFDRQAVHGEFVIYAAIGIWNRPRQWYRQA